MSDRKWNKRVLLPIMEWCYGDKNRGISPEQLWFMAPLQHWVEDVKVVWIDDYLEDSASLEKILLAEAEEYDPDLIFFIPMRYEFSESLLKQLSAKYDTMGWFGDDQWRFEDFSSKQSQLYNRAITTDPLCLQKYHKLGVEPLLSEWAGVFDDRFQASMVDRKYQFDISFVGGVNQARRWFISQLQKRGLKVACFGHGWESGAISFDEMFEIFNSSRINLNISNSIPRDYAFLFGGVRNLIHFVRSTKDVEQVKARNFEIPLCGGFQLTNYMFGLERHFVMGKELVAFGSVGECVKVIDYFQHNEQQRKAIEVAGHRRAVEEHTYISRFNKILTDIWPE